MCYIGIESLLKLLTIGNEIEPMNILLKTRRDIMNKYYDLAMAMRKTKSDFSNGFYRVVDELTPFQEDMDTSIVDQEIYAELFEIVSDEEYQDGRVFRDCDWNYDRIIEKFLSKEEKQKLDFEFMKWFKNL
jgi:hypothetical protein